MSLADLKKVLKEKKLVFGNNETLRNLKNGKTLKVFLAKNCTAKMKEDILYYAKLANAEVVQLDEPNDELALICKKNYPVTVVSY